MKYRFDKDFVVEMDARDQKQRGCQLSLVVKNKGKEIFRQLIEAGVVCDWCEPDVIRVVPVPLYNSFMDVYRLGEILKRLI